MTEPTKAVIRAFLDHPQGERYGLDICNTINFAPGTVHPILMRLEGLGWLESHWEELDPSAAGRPRRRYYRLTHSGMESAQNALVRAEQRATRSGRERPSSVRLTGEIA